MRELTIKEEYDLLKEVFENSYTFIHNGSSRAVFLLPDNRVIKIAMDKQGRRQNQNEVYLFEKEGSAFLAEIFSYGRFVVVMEEVFEEYMEHMMDIYNESDEIEYSQAEYNQVVDIINLLEEYNGSTDDNFQIGTSKITGKFVSFDYGYSKEYDHKDIVSNSLCDTVDDNGPDYVVEKAMARLKKLLDRSEKICYNKV